MPWAVVLLPRGIQAMEFAAVNGGRAIVIAVGIGKRDGRLLIIGVAPEHTRALDSLEVNTVGARVALITVERKVGTSVVRDGQPRCTHGQHQCQQ